MASPFVRIIKQLGYTRQLVKRNLFRIIVPGLPYTAFDAYELPSPWAVINLLDSSQTGVLNMDSGGKEESLMELGRMSDVHPVYIAASKVQFLPRLYDKSLVKAPLQLDTSLSHVGKSTFVLDTEMRVQDVPLAYLRQSQILMDESIKKPLPIPDWWKEEYSSLFVPKEPLKFPELKKPSFGVKSVSIGQVPFSDADANFHVNFSNYLKYCMDAFVKGQTEGTEKRMFDKPVLVKSAFLWYRQECLVGNHLIVEYWAEKSEDNTYYFNVSRNSESVCQCIMEFMDSTQSSL